MSVAAIRRQTRGTDSPRNCCKTTTADMTAHMPPVLAEALWK
jgi:hypothetical protein